MKTILLTFVALFAISTGYSQELWQPAMNTYDKALKPNEYKQNTPTKNLFTLDVKQMSDLLLLAPRLGHTASKSSVKLPFPNTQGTMEWFTIYESAILQPGLSAKYPNIKSYVGQGIDNPTAKIRFSMTQNGLFGLCLGTGRSFVINALASKSNLYHVYTHEEASKDVKTFACGTTEPVKSYGQKPQSAARKRNAGEHRTFRLALSTTAEYTSHYGSKEDAMAEIANTLTYVNAIFETDFGITLELIANNDVLIFEDPDTDPYTPAPSIESARYRRDLADTVNKLLSPDEYDLQHLFDLGGANLFGQAIMYTVCHNTEGNGYTVLSSYSSNKIISYALATHELGHQFGAYHTYGHQDDGWDVNSHIEPGTGSTIMSYAGKGEELGHAVVEEKDPYFHAFSIAEVLDFISEQSCGTTNFVDNTTPMIASSSTSNFVIPLGTPFVLDLPATDSDGDALTYCWEQMDSDKASTIIPDPFSKSGPAFRSYPPTESSARYFPRLETIQNGNTQWKWEAIPEVERTMNFRLTVRDNHQGGGATAYSDVIVETKDTGGSFKITEPLSPNWALGSTQNISWDIAGTTENGIDVDSVDILLSVDGGNTFPINLVENTPNDGEQTITVPYILETNVRIMVKAVDHIFFDISDYDIIISGEGSVDTCVSLSDALRNPDISGLISAVNTEFSSTGENADAQVAFTHHDDKLIIAANTAYLEGVRLKYDENDGYIIVQNAQGELVLISENDIPDGIICSNSFTVQFINTTHEKFSYATDLPEVASELQLHPEMALLSYLATVATEQPDVAIRSGGTGKMSARSYKYLSDNSFWTADEFASAQYDYQDIEKNSGWSLPNYWIPTSEHEKIGGWSDWLRRCSATYYENRTEFEGVNKSGETTDLSELGYFAIPRNPGASD